MERAALKALVRATGCAEVAGDFVFLCNPGWGMAERAHVDALKATVAAGTERDPEDESGHARPVDSRRSAVTAARNGLGWLCLPTGGSSGALRFARHDELTLTAAVTGFCAHFGIDQVNAIDVLPPYHVSGLMARVRCAATGGRHLPGDWKQIEAGHRPALTGGHWVISLVPTQLQRLLAQPDAVAWLRGFRSIFIGGGPIWPGLADAGAEADLRLSLSYGMTETAAMVTALKPEEFLAGERSSGTALPHATISLSDAGAIEVGGESVFRGYFPELRAERFLLTDDAGRLDPSGHLHVLGRRDAVIITGGEKVNPAEVEDVLRSTGEFSDVAVIGVSDTEWGQAVIACYPAEGRAPGLTVVEAAVAQRLAAYKRPKRYVPIAEWPRNLQGKLNRAVLAERARAALAKG